MGDTPPTEGGLLSSVSRLFQTVRDTAENRLELFLTELKEERIRLFDALLWFGITVVCALMTLATLTFTLIIIFWDTHRWLVLGILIAAYATFMVVAFLKLSARLQRWESFSATMGEIKKDAACFTKPN